MLKACCRSLVHRSGSSLYTGSCALPCLHRRRAPSVMIRGAKYSPSWCPQRFRPPRPRPRHCMLSKRVLRVVIVNGFHQYALYGISVCLLTAYMCKVSPVAAPPDERSRARNAILQTLPLIPDAPTDVLKPIVIPQQYTFHDFVTTLPVVRVHSSVIFDFTNPKVVR